MTFTYYLISDKSKSVWNWRKEYVWVLGCKYYKISWIPPPPVLKILKKNVHNIMWGVFSYIHNENKFTYYKIQKFNVKWTVFLISRTSSLTKYQQICKNKLDLLWTYDERRSHQPIVTCYWLKTADSVLGLWYSVITWHSFTSYTKGGSPLPCRISWTLEARETRSYY